MIYTITRMRHPADDNQQASAIEMLHQYGKVSRERSFLIVKESLTAYKRSEPVNIEVNIPDGIAPGCMRELELYFDFVKGSFFTGPITITITLKKILDGVKLDDARETLKNYAELEDSHAIFIVRAVSNGNSMAVKVRHGISVGAIKKIREHFEMLDHKGSPGKPYGYVDAKDHSGGVAQQKPTVNLKLWTVKYYIKGNPLKITALVLAETSEIAGETLWSITTVAEIIMVTEVKGPFVNGHLLTRSMVV